MKPNIVCERCKGLGLFAVLQGCRCKVDCPHPTEHVPACRQCSNELRKRDAFPLDWGSWKDITQSLGRTSRNEVERRL